MAKHSKSLLSRESFLNDNRGAYRDCQGLGLMIGDRVNTIDHMINFQNLVIENLYVNVTDNEQFATMKPITDFPDTSKVRINYPCKLITKVTY